MSKKLNKEEAHLNYKKYVKTARKWYRKNRERVKAKTRKYYSIKENYERLRKNQNARRQEFTEIVFLKYSNGDLKCACCGEKQRRFLTLDHIDGNGNKHRREIKATCSMTLYRWIKKNNYPPMFQILCMNCNWGKALNKNICPHKDILFGSKKKK